MRVVATLAAALLAAATPAAAQQGAAAAMATERCAACHGEDGRSALPNTPSLAGQPADFITLQLILMREQLRQAPPMNDIARDLTDPQIEALAAHYAALRPGPPDDRGPRDAALYERGAALSAPLNCGVCHLRDFSGRNQVPRIAGQREEYLVQSMTEYREARRQGTDTSMNAVMHGVTAADIAALAHFLAQQP